jgi:nucleoside-diphosphate kinase
MVERTLILVKPDGVQRGLTGEIIRRFEQRGLKIVGLKLLRATEEVLAQHYAEHVGRDFYPGLLRYIQSGPIVAIVLEGENAIEATRTTIGATKAHTAAAGTIRGDLALNVSNNLVHGSANAADAAREVPIWFGDGELLDYGRAIDPWIAS